MRIGFKIATVMAVVALALVLSLSKATVTAPAAQASGGITAASLDQKAQEYQQQHEAQFGPGYPDFLGSNVVAAAGSSAAQLASAGSYC